MKPILVIIFVGFFTFSACQVAEPIPVNQTEVFLQASFQFPQELEGFPSGTSVMKYLVWLPKGYGEDPTREWPLIFFLHGSGASEYDSTYVMRFGLPEVLFSQDQPEPFDFIVIAPQAFSGTAWWMGDQLAILNALLDEAIALYRVDASRVYLTGLSMGGFGAWHLATQYADRFAAMASISGSGFQTPTIPSDEVFCKLQELPTWVIHGLEDRIAAPSAVKLFAFTLSGCGGEVKISMWEDEDHFSTYTRAYRDADLYSWFLDHSLEERE